MTSAGRFPAAVVAAPVNAWAAAPSMRRVAVPPVAVEAWLRAPWAASVPVPLMAPVVRLTEPAAVRVVPAAIDVDARKSSALRVWFFLQAQAGMRAADVPGVQACAVSI